MSEAVTTPNPPATIIIIVRTTGPDKNDAAQETHEIVDVTTALSIVATLVREVETGAIESAGITVRDTRTESDWWVGTLPNAATAQLLPCCTRCDTPITDPENTPRDGTALCKRCGDPS